MVTDRFNAILSSLENESRLRVIPAQASGKEMDLCSNDYLGLAPRHEEFLDEFLDRFGDAAFSSSASRLLAGRQNHYLALEKYLSDGYGKPALLFNSGYHANVGCISALGAVNPLFLCDRLIHASVIDGLMLSKAKFERWRHNDIDHLTLLIEKNYDKYEDIVVVAESVYSMDGDIAPLSGLVELKRQYPKIILYIDEAHALGVFGDNGFGLSEKYGLTDSIDIIIGTFGKACASQGAFVAASQVLIDFFLNSARSFIFSTALPPVNVAWTLFMLEKIRSMNREREHLAAISEQFRVGLEEISGKKIDSRSQIVPYVTGDAKTAIAIARRLREKNILALPIRRPTVPPGGERIRFSLNANLTANDIAKVIETMI